MSSEIALLKVLSKLKTTPRTGWTRCGITENPETIGAHSFGVALITWLLSRENEIDTKKAIEIALVHDLLEAYTGDITPLDLERTAKRNQLEQAAILELEEILPEEIKDEIIPLIREFREQETPESIIVKEADRLDTAFQAFFYEERRYGDHPKDSVFSNFFEFAREICKEGYSKKLLEEIEALRQ